MDQNDINRFIAQKGIVDEGNIVNQEDLMDDISAEELETLIGMDELTQKISESRNK